MNQGLARVYLRKDTAGPDVVMINLGRPEAFETKLENPDQDSTLASGGPPALVREA